MSEQTPLLRLENLCKDYGQGMILHHLNLDIEQGEFLTLLGPSGCGKTTTLRMIAGLESVTEGRVWLEGRDITQLPPEKRPLNTVFQSYALFPHMNVFQNIAYGLKVKGVKKAEQKERVEEALRLVRLSGYEKRMPSQLSGGQRQGGVSFTLPSDQVVIHSQLSLAVRVSPEMASRNATLQLMLNGQPLGTLPLGADGEDVSHYQLDIPPALMVSSNNLSVKINDGDTLQCQRDIHDSSRVTVLPTSHFSWESQQLNISDDLSHFPRPFFDSMQMTPADIAVAYGAKPSADVFSAAALVSSWLGIQADYRGIAFSALRDRLPERHGIVIGHPGEQVGGMTLPETDKPLLRIIANPANPAYKLLLIVGKNDTALRMAAWRLTRGNFAPQTATLDVEPQIIPVGKAYDAPRWIPTDRPVRLSELLRKDQSPTVSGVWHEPLRIAFRAAPDLYLWDGETIPLQVGYRFPSESWINEDKSLLSVTLNGTFLNNLAMNKQGPLEKVWRHLGGDARQERFTIPLAPYLIYGDNQLSMYFNVVPKDDVPCSVLLNNNIKSRITDDSWIDLSKTRHFSLLPNLSYFVGASFQIQRGKADKGKALQHNGSFYNRYAQKQSASLQHSFYFIAPERFAQDGVMWYNHILSH